MFRPLCAENPLPAARRVYEYLQSLSGKCLTGQMESQWCRSTEHEISYLTDVTGRQPAIRGLDFMDNDYLGVTQRAKDWWARGGIPTICWHTGADFFSGYPECRESELDWAFALWTARKRTAVCWMGLTTLSPTSSACSQTAFPFSGGLSTRWTAAGSGGDAAARRISCACGG